MPPHERSEPFYVDHVYWIKSKWVGRTKHDLQLSEVAMTVKEN